MMMNMLQVVLLALKTSNAGEKQTMLRILLVY